MANETKLKATVKSLNEDILKATAYMDAHECDPEESYCVECEDTDHQIYAMEESYDRAIDNLEDIGIRMASNGDWYRMDIKYA